MQTLNVRFRQILCSRFLSPINDINILSGGVKLTHFNQWVHYVLSVHAWKQNPKTEEYFCKRVITSIWPQMRSDLFLTPVVDILTSTWSCMSPLNYWGGFMSSPRSAIIIIIIKYIQYIQNDTSLECLWGNIHWGESGRQSRRKHHLDWLYFIV